MTAVLRYAALLTLLVLPVACVAPTTPSALRRQQPISQPPPPAQPPPVPAPPPEQPPLTGPNTAYVFSGPLSYPVSGYTRESKFVLYDSGAFAFTYPEIPDYLGAYHRENGRISFDFQTNGSEDASGDLKDDLLEIRFSDRMHHADFEDAVYRRSQ